MCQVSYAPSHNTLPTQIVDRRLSTIQNWAAMTLGQQRLQRQQCELHAPQLLVWLQHLSEKQVV